MKFTQFVSMCVLQQCIVVDGMKSAWVLVLYRVQLFSINFIITDIVCDWFVG